MSARRWHLLGPGAMGCLFARQLAAAGCPLNLLPRRAPREREAVVEIVEGGETVSFPVALSAAADGDVIRHLLVATKAPDLAAAVAGVAHRLTPGTAIVLAANGMGFLDAARAAAGGADIHCCSSTEGAFRLGELRVRHAGRGITLIGRPGGGPAPDWLEDWLAGPLDCRWEEDIEQALWHKLAINCAINPLTALHRCANGALASDPALRAQVHALCDEIAAVSAAAGYPRTAASVHRDVAAVIANTAANRSSMLQDTLAGRPTEIDYITGHLLEVAGRYGVDAPGNRQLYRQLGGSG